MFLCSGCCEFVHKWERCAVLACKKTLIFSEKRVLRLPLPYVPSQWSELYHMFWSICYNNFIFSDTRMVWREDIRKTSDIPHFALRDGIWLIQTFNLPPYSTLGYFQYWSVYIFSSVLLITSDSSKPCPPCSLKTCKMKMVVSADDHQ